MHIPRQVTSIPNDNLLDLVTVTLGSSRKSLNPVGLLLQNYGMYKMVLEIKRTFEYVRYFMKHNFQYICVI